MDPFGCKYSWNDAIEDRGNMIFFILNTHLFSRFSRGEEQLEFNAAFTRMIKTNDQNVFLAAEFSLGSRGILQLQVQGLDRE